MLLKIDQVSAGMELAEDVILPNGKTLLSSSAVLTVNMIATLKKYGISNVQVISAPAPEPDKPQNEVSIKEEAPVANEPDPTEMSIAEEAAATLEEAGEKVLPNIRVTTENGGMSALLRIEPGGNANESFTTDDLREVLHENNVFFGINELLLDKATKSWHSSHEIIEIEHIAQGIAPIPGRESDLDILVKCIKNKRDFDQAKAVSYCWQLSESAIPIQQVDPGTVIALKEIGIPGIPGKNVHGDEIPSDQVIKKEVNVSENVEVDEKKDEFRSKITGLTYYIDNSLGVTPMNFDGSAELVISNDKMRAELMVHRCMENGKPPTEKSIRDLLATKSVTYGINNQLLQELTAEISKAHFPDKPVVIAEGTPPIEGENGKIEYLFDTQTSLIPKVNASGVADYKNVSIIHSVTKDKELARLVPPTKGSPGKNILGENIPCKEATPATLPIGANTGQKPDDASVLIALTDGNVRLNGQVVEIVEGFTIKGDVDYSSGNISYDKSVSISGDIKSGFSVVCGGDCEIGGTIEDASLQIGGSVLTRYGFIGQGKGIIECKGDVNIGFLKNQTIRCRGSVNIAREALNGKIFARKSITVSGKSLSIAGGSCTAKESITCNVVGNSSGIHTTLEVGLDFTLLDEIEKTKKQITELLENRQKLLETVRKFEKMLTIRKRLAPKEEFLFAKLKNSIVKYNTQLKTLEDRKSIVETKLNDPGNAFIRIEHSAMPGTVIKIGDRHLVVHDEIIGPKLIRSINYEIRII